MLAIIIIIIIIISLFSVGIMLDLHSGGNRRTGSKSGVGGQQLSLAR